MRTELCRPNLVVRSLAAVFCATASVVLADVPPQLQIDNSVLAAQYGPTTANIHYTVKGGTVPTTGKIAWTLDGEAMKGAPSSVSLSLGESFDGILTTPLLQPGKHSVTVKYWRWNFQKRGEPVPTYFAETRLSIDVPSPPPQPMPGDLIATFCFKSPASGPLDVVFTGSGPSGGFSSTFSQRVAVQVGPGLPNCPSVHVYGLNKGKWSVTASAPSVALQSCPAVVPGLVTLDVSGDVPVCKQGL